MNVFELNYRVVEFFSSQ